LSNVQSTEIIIIDNGSTDDSVKWIQNNFKNIKIIKNKTNLGVTTAWNQGIQSSSGDFICIANNDLIFSKNCIKNLINTLNNYDWVGVVSPYSQQDETRNVPSFALPAVPYQKDNFNDYKQYNRLGYTGWCFMFRRIDLKQNFDPKYFLWYQDDDFLNQQLFHIRGIPPFRFPAPGKVPLLIKGAEVKHQYSSSHDQLDSNWITKTVNKEKKYFKKKWRGYKGNAYLKDINWGEKIYLNEPKYSILSEKNTIIKHRIPLVSTIIPCFNRKKRLVKTIDAIINQTYKNQELIFIDDCSEKSLEDTIQKGLESFSGNWKIIRTSHNAGPGIARKIGMNNSSGEYLQFLDSDDEPMPNKISKQIKVLEQNKNLIMTYATTLIGKKINEMSILGLTNENKQRIFPLFPYKVYWTTSSVLWRASCISKNAWYPLYGSEDLLFEFLNGLMDLPIKHTPSKEPLLKKWLHPENISSQIATDYLYQMEILKCYDLMVNKLDVENIIFERKTIGELYKDKIMFFLTHRRYNEASYCIERYLKLSKNKLNIENAAFLLSKLFSISKIYKLLRMYYWSIKIIKNKF